jgi:hypothetical protein
MLGHRGCRWGYPYGNLRHEGQGLFPGWARLVEEGLKPIPEVEYPVIDVKELGYFVTG